MTAYSFAAPAMSAKPTGSLRRRTCAPGSKQSNGLTPWARFASKHAADREFIQPSCCQANTPTPTTQHSESASQSRSTPCANSSPFPPVASFKHSLTTAAHHGAPASLPRDAPPCRTPLQRPPSPAA
jgi:hypothetical protein